MSGEGPKRRARRSLRADERHLWTSVTQSVAPLRAHIPPASMPVADDADHNATAAAQPPAGATAVPAAAAAKPAPGAPPLASLGRRLKQRLVRGRDPIDARIDLHGLTQSDAHARLRQFLHTARADGARFVLVITGKGGDLSEQGAFGRGVLRRQVPLWLRLPEFRNLVVGFEPAHPGHGGEGALYVRVRRARRTSGKP